MNRLTFHASRLPHSPGGGAPRTTSCRRAAPRGSHTTRGDQRGHRPRRERRLPRAERAPRAGPRARAASAAPSVSDIEYAPVSMPGRLRVARADEDRQQRPARSRPRARPARSPRTAAATPPAPRSAAATAVSSAQPTQQPLDRDPPRQPRRERREGAEAEHRQRRQQPGREAREAEVGADVRRAAAAGSATSVRRFSASSTIAAIAPRDRARAPRADEPARRAAGRRRRRSGSPPLTSAGARPARRAGPPRSAPRWRAAPARGRAAPPRSTCRLACADRLTAAIVVPVAVADRRRDRAQPLLELLVDERPALRAHLRELGPQRLGATSPCAARAARSSTRSR